MQPNHSKVVRNRAKTFEAISQRINLELSICNYRQGRVSIFVSLFKVEYRVFIIGLCGFR